MRQALAAVIAPIAVALITSLGGLYAVYYTSQKEIEQTQIEGDALRMDRVQHLEDRVDRLSREVTDLQIKNAELEGIRTQQQVQIGLLQAKLTAPGAPTVEPIFKVLDSLREVPAWCKSVIIDEGGLPKFVMAHINSAYAFSFGVSYDFYVGKTDFQVHPDDIAQAYYTNDLMVYRRKDYIDFWEPIAVDDKLRKYIRFWKFFHAVDNDGVELICGWKVPHSPYPDG